MLIPKIKKRSVFLIILPIICLLIKFKIYKYIIPDAIYDFTNPRQLEGIMLILFYLSVPIQIIVTISLLINLKKISKTDIFILIFSFCLLLFNIWYQF